MQKDLKTGLVLGMVLAVTATLWFATHPRQSPKARMLHLHNAESRPESPEPLSSPADTKSPAPDIDIREPANPPVKGSTIKLDSALTTDYLETKQSTTRDLTVYEQAEKIRPERFHIITKGQTLSGIAHEYYGSAGKWQKILDANRKIIKDANKLTPGTKLIIPE